MVPDPSVPPALLKKMYDETSLYADVNDFRHAALQACSVWRTRLKSHALSKKPPHSRIKEVERELEGGDDNVVELTLEHKCNESTTPVWWSD